MTFSNLIHSKSFRYMQTYQTNRFLQQNKIVKNTADIALNFLYYIQICFFNEFFFYELENKRRIKMSMLSILYFIYIPAQHLHLALVRYIMIPVINAKIIARIVTVTGMATFSSEEDSLNFPKKNY